VRRVAATRYVTPLREGGSLPALVEADDDRLYVVKCRGAGQGPKALVAEPFSYAILRLVPDIERGERINVGVIVFCRPLDLLGARTALDEARALGGDVDLEAAGRHLAATERIARGDPEAGPIAALDTTARFHRLAAPASTIVQPSEVHTGLCDDPGACLDELFERLVG
jgi:hypothetical protein